MTVGGIEATVVSEQEAEQADMVVCCRAGMFSPFADNVETTCASCSRPIFHRPSAPKRPMKVCIECAGEIAGSTKQ